LPAYRRIAGSLHCDRRGMSPSTATASRERKRNGSRYSGFSSGLTTGWQRTSPIARRPCSSLGPTPRSASIATFFVREGEYRFGRLHRDEDRVEMHDERQPGDEELVGAAAVATGGTGGEVSCHDEEEFNPIQPVMQQRIWDRMPADGGPQALAAAIEILKNDF